MANAISSINTRIILRNDTLANWNGSSKVLLKGEAALARLEGALSDYFQLRIGTGEKTWAQLEPSNIIIPSQNIDGLTYNEYKLSSLEVATGEKAKFQLVGKNPKTGEWQAIGDAITIPDVDLAPVNSKIETLSGAIDVLSDAIDEQTAEIDLKYNKSDFAKLCADIGLNAANSTNKVVTFKDIADLEGSMHFKGVTTADLETGSTVIPTDVYSEGESPKAGDVVINETTLKEFVWGGATASWHELGHEGVWATQEALNNEVEDRKTAVKDLSTALDDKMKNLSSDTQTKVHVLSGAIKDLTSETSDLSTATDKLSSNYNTLSSNYNTLSSNYNTLEGKVNNKVLINVDGKDVSAETLKIYRVDDDTYYDKVIKGHALSNELYIVSNDFINAYGQQMKNLSAPADDDDATTKKYVDDQITAVSQEIAEVNDGLKELSTYTHALSVSQLVWDLVIDCGSASSD